MTKELIIIGGGLAGSEAAWQALNRGIKVTMYEMRDHNRSTPAHRTDKLAELVCSNSFRAADHESSAIGLLHQEMRLNNSLVIKSADNHAIPAGGALAVDREAFSNEITSRLFDHPNFTLIREEITDIKELEDKKVIIATGPLTSDKLTLSILRETGLNQLAFFDAIAPIIYKESINFDIAWMQSRYNKTGNHGNGSDYINCPMTKEQYYNFIDELLKAEKTEFKDWEKDTPYFEGCLPIEVMAERGVETLRFGPMKPVGLSNPHSKLPSGDLCTQNQSILNICEETQLPSGDSLKFKLAHEEQVLEALDAQDRSLLNINEDLSTKATTQLPSGVEFKPYAVVQLRQDNKAGTLYNMVGFQTKLKYKEQSRIFTMIPGLENAEFAKLGGIHRNTFINSPKLLDKQLRLKSLPNIRFAGQITGVEGYVESASMGMLAGIFASHELLGLDAPSISECTAMGSLLNHITENANADNFQPTNINYGLMPGFDKKIRDKKLKKKMVAERALKEAKLEFANTL